MYVLCTLLAIVAGFALYFWSKFREGARFWRKRGFDTVGSEVSGNIFSVVANRLLQHEVDAKIYKHVKTNLRKSFVGISEFSKPVLFVTDLDLARHIFIKDFDVFMNRRQFAAMESTDPMFFKMLFFMEGEPWKELRNTMSPTFTTGKIRRLFEVFNTSSAELVKHLRHEADEHDQVVDFKDAYERYTMGVISSAAFGVDAKTFEEKDSIFQKMGKKMQFEIDPLLMLKFILMIASPPLSKALGISITADRVAEVFFTKVITDVIRHREKTGESRDDFLQLMLEARSGQLKAVDESELSTFEKEGGFKATTDKSQRKGTVALTELSDDIIIAQSLLFILAGFDTTQTLLLFAVYELTVNPDAQQRLSSEIENSLKKSNGEFTYDMINQLEYLDWVVQETLRKYPPVPRLERRATMDYTIPGTKLMIPKDIIVGIPTYSIHHDEEYFPNPERFEPERFSNEVKNARHPYAFQPFGHGPRNCIGMRFALTNAKMAIASIVHNFVLEPSSQTLIPMKFGKSTSLKPESMFLKLTPRK